MENPLRRRNAGFFTRTDGGIVRRQYPTTQTVPSLNRVNSWPESMITLFNRRDSGYSTRRNSTN